MSMGEGGRISWGRLIVGVVLALGVASALAVLIGPLVAISLAGGSHFQVRDNAMAPALVAGDWVLARELHPGDVPERGDIVVYETDGSRGFEQEQIGRVVGLPGERIQMRGGALYIDGQRVAMERIGERVVDKRPPARRSPLPHCLNDPVDIGAPCRQEIWRETLPGGAAHRVINSRNEVGVAKLSDRRGGDDTRIFRVPEDHVFVMGDNRDIAFDSRDRRHGTVPLDRVGYRVWMIHTSLDRSARFPVPRWGRFFREVE